MKNEESLTGAGLKMGVYSVVGATAGAATGGEDGLEYICIKTSPASRQVLPQIHALEFAIPGSCLNAVWQQKSCRLSLNSLMMWHPPAVNFD